MKGPWILINLYNIQLFLKHEQNDITANLIEYNEDSHNKNYQVTVINILQTNTEKVLLAYDNRKGTLS